MARLVRITQLFTLHGQQCQAFLLQQLQQTLDSHRLANFTGAMLRHHSMKSTQYMAQWIEAKNRK